MLQATVWAMRSSRTSNTTSTRSSVAPRDLRVGLLLLMASMDTFAGEPVDCETEPNAYKMDRPALIVCVP